MYSLPASLRSRHTSRDAYRLTHALRVRVYAYRRHSTSLHFRSLHFPSASLHVPPLGKAALRMRAFWHVRRVSRVFLPAPAGGQRRSSVHVSRPCPFSLRRDSTAGKVSLRGSVLAIPADRRGSGGRPGARAFADREYGTGSRVARPRDRARRRFQTRGVPADLARRAALRWKNPAREAIPEAR